MPYQTVLPAQHKMTLIVKRQESTFDPSSLADGERRQSFRDRTSKVLIAVNDQHGRVPIVRVARRVPFVPPGPILPKCATEVGDESCWYVGG